MKDPKEAALRKTLKTLERRYDTTAEKWRLQGRGEGYLAARLRTLGEQIDTAQKALNDYLAGRSP